MKTNIKARITCLFISKTTIMVNKCETIYFIISNFRQTAFVFLSLFNFIPLLLLISSFFPYLFRFNFVIFEWNVHILDILFCRHIWSELSLLFWIFLSGTFFPGWGEGGGGGGGLHVHPVHPPCVRA